MAYDPVVDDPTVPPDGMLPVPVHPVVTYWQPEPQLTGVVTDEPTRVPESYVPAPVGESYAELTLRAYVGTVYVTTAYMYVLRSRPLVLWWSPMYMALMVE
jgi:hypothetical protein